MKPLTILLLLLAYNFAVAQDVDSNRSTSRAEALIRFTSELDKISNAEVRCGEKIRVAKTLHKENDFDDHSIRLLEECLGEIEDRQSPLSTVRKERLLKRILTFLASESKEGYPLFKSRFPILLNVEAPDFDFGLLYDSRFAPDRAVPALLKMLRNKKYQKDQTSQLYLNRLKSSDPDIGNRVARELERDFYRETYEGDQQMAVSAYRLALYLSSGFKKDDFLNRVFSFVESVKGESHPHYHVGREILFRSQFLASFKNAFPKKRDSLMALISQYQKSEIRFTNRASNEQLREKLKRKIDSKRISARSEKDPEKRANIWLSAAVDSLSQFRFDEALDFASRSNQDVPNSAESFLYLLILRAESKREYRVSEKAFLLLRKPLFRARALLEFALRGGETGETELKEKKRFLIASLRESEKIETLERLTIVRSVLYFAQKRKGLDFDSASITKTIVRAFNETFSKNPLENSPDSVVVLYGHLASFDLAEAEQQIDRIEDPDIRILASLGLLLRKSYD